MIATVSASAFSKSKFQLVQNDPEVFEVDLVHCLSFARPAKVIDRRLLVVVGFAAFPMGLLDVRDVRLHIVTDDSIEFPTTRHGDGSIRYVARRGFHLRSVTVSSIEREIVDRSQVGLRSRFQPPVPAQASEQFVVDGRTGFRAENRLRPRIPGEMHSVVEFVSPRPNERLRDALDAVATDGSDGVEIPDEPVLLREVREGVNTTRIQYDQKIPVTIEDVRPERAS